MSGQTDHDRAISEALRHGITIEYGPDLVPPPPRRPSASDDADALDRIQHMLRDPEWGVGMLEDIGDIVRGTGRDVDNLPGDAPTWGRH